MPQNVFPANSSASVHVSVSLRVWVCGCACVCVWHMSPRCCWGQSTTVAACQRCCFCCCCWHCCVVMSRLRRPEMASMSTSTPKFLADTRLHVCVCVRDSLCACVCVGVVVCGGKGGWHVRVWLAAARLCLWSLSVSAVASRARLQSFIIKIFCTRIFINCFVSHPPQHTHSHTFRTHTHAWGERHFYEANLMLSFFISHFCCAIFGFYSLFGAPQKRRGKWKRNCNMRPASNYCRHHKATPNGHLSKL